MTDQQYEYQPQPVEEREGVSLATIVFGLILLILGTLWLLDVADVINVTWTLVGSVILIVLGVVLIGAARHGEHGGMIFLGVALSVVVLLGSLASWPGIEGGLGERISEPVAVSELDEEYNWGLGNQIFDFRGLDLPDGETATKIQMGLGNLEIRVPPDAGYRIDWSVGAGNAEIFDQENSGPSIDGVYQSDNYDEADRQFSIEIRHGLGNLEVYE